MLNLDQNLLVLDLETSGVNPFVNEVLAVGLAPARRPDLARTIYVRPPGEITFNEYARRNFEKFSKEWESKAVSPAEACSQIEDYVRDVMPEHRATLVGHNVGFDQAFLRKLAFQGGREQLAGISHRAIDTHTVLYLLHAEHLLPSAALSSDGAFRHFNIRVEDNSRHTAQADALATRELFGKALELLSTRRAAATA
jgi:DNA polymerase III epsilon subunit-like protein